MKKYIQYTHTCTLDGSLSSLKTFILKHCFIFNAVKTKFGEKCMKTSGLLFLLFVFFSTFDNTYINFCNQNKSKTLNSISR